MTRTPQPLLAMLLFVSVFQLKDVAASPNHRPRSSDEYAQRLYTRLVGVSPRIDSPLFGEVARQVRAGALKEAALLAMKDPLFYAVRMRLFSAPYSSRELSPAEPFNDLQALFIGIARDDLDARQLLTGDFRYQGLPGSGLPKVSLSDNQHYTDFVNLGLSFEKDLIRVEHQWDELPEASGALTTRAWAKAHYLAGTNRRALKMALELFACTPLEALRMGGVTDSYVRRDVDRAPGGNSATYQNHCRLCHAPMDGMGGAFARLDFTNGTLTHSGFLAVTDKMNQHAEVYPAGRAVLDDTWTNLVASHPSLDLGWRGATEGQGVLAFGRMISESRAFSRCLVKRSFREICSRDARDSETAWVESLAADFEKGGYRLKDLFAAVATREECAGSASSLSIRREPDVASTVSTGSCPALGARPAAGLAGVSSFHAE